MLAFVKDSAFYGEQACDEEMQEHLRVVRLRDAIFALNKQNSELEGLRYYHIYPDIIVCMIFGVQISCF